jgi:hypothetical protein
MRPRALIVTFTSALAATLAVAAPSPAVTRSARPQTLLFDAVATNTRTGGPDADHVGHEQIASGALRNAAGHRVGHYAFTCRWIQILANGDAREHCAGRGQTADGRLDFAGFTRSSAATHTFTTTGGTRRYRDVRGVLVTRDLGDTDSLITATMTPRHGSLLRVGTVPRLPADARFEAHANRRCRRASRQVAALPAFPFADFDPLHPDPALLPQVGAFFTGPGDPRPILRALNGRLRELGEPPANRGAWNRALRARAAAYAVIHEQDAAALAADVPAFVRSVHDSAKTFRRIAITATVFGAIDCGAV